MKFISWNVNGLRACINKGFMDFFNSSEADFFAIQETKMQKEQVAFELEHDMYFNDAQKKGYSGTAIFTKHKPISVSYGIGIEEHDNEGRVVTLEYDGFFLVNVYTPNSQRELTRLNYRMEWEEAFLAYLKGLDAKKPLILCGDLNVAHKEIDLKNPKQNKRNAGFTDEERGKFDGLLSAGFVDSFRLLYPDTEGAYTWWSYFGKSRERNTGWRIDYFVISERLSGLVKEAKIYPDIHGSDHCPVGLEVDLSGL